MTETFEIGFTMAGAISAGAYTAGVMDFIFEALDAYYAARKQPGWDGPVHDVRIPIMAGASAGGMTSAICALHAFRDRFDHVWPQDEARKVPERRRNRLYSSWVEDIDIRRLLETSDIANGPKSAPVRSLLCCDVIDRIVEDAFDLDGEIRAPEWIGRGEDKSLRVRLTLTNLRGVPYSFQIFGSGDQRLYGMLNHGDLMDFKVGFAPAAEPGAYELDISNTKTPEWDRYRTVAKATGAFPIGLAPRFISRSPAHYAFISAMRYGDAVGRPDKWIDGIDPYEFVAIDGGTIDNEPLEITRRYLSGGAEVQNANDGLRTKKAVILVAPFPNFLDSKTDELKTASDDLSLMRVATTLVGTLTNQARFKPDEIRRASDEKYYSRYLISPTRDPIGTEESIRYPIACGVLGGFGGFLHQSFRRHDYLLGRRNAQAFLRWHFTLPEKAAIFRDFTGDREKWRIRDQSGGPDYKKVATRDEGDLTALPIIPLTKELTREIVIPADSMPDYSAVFGPARDPLDNLIHARAAAVIDRLIEVHMPFGDSLIGGAQRWGAKRVATKFAVETAKGKIAQAVDEARRAFYKNPGP